MTLHANSIASATPLEQSRFIDSLTAHELFELQYNWDFWARPEQTAPPGDWQYWMYLGGRGAGKTRSGAEWARQQIEVHGRMRGAFVAPTKADYRGVMVEGISGVLACSRPDNMPIFQPSTREVIWPNGATVTLFSSEEPERLRGPQFEFAWADELCAWSYLQKTWDMLQFGLRLGPNPQMFISTTPKPSETLKFIMTSPYTVMTTGSSYANRANLSPQFFGAIVKKYEGTRLGRQELNAEVIGDMPGALWTRGLIEAKRIQDPLAHFKVTGISQVARRMKRVVIGVDPSGSDDETGALQGIVVAAEGFDGRYYVLHDGSTSESPDGWGRKVAGLYETWGASLIVAETNYGGKMVVFVIRSAMPNAPVKTMTASQGKHIRAEPVAALYEQGKVSHVGGFPALEDQMCNITHDGYQGVGSPDRLDALVWALTELAFPGKRQGYIMGVSY